MVILPAQDVADVQVAKPKTPCGLSFGVGQFDEFVGYHGVDFGIAWNVTETLLGYTCEFARAADAQLTTVSEFMRHLCTR